jgi:hypothetical protein
MHTDLSTRAELFLRIEGEEDESMTVICGFDLRREFVFLHCGRPRTLQERAINLAHAFPSSQYKLSENCLQTRIPSGWQSQRAMRRGWDGPAELERRLNQLGV